MYLLALTSFISAASAYQRFKEWFPKSAKDFASISADTCNSTLSAFDTAYDQSTTSKPWIDLGVGTGSNDPVYQLCRDHVSCILNNVSEDTKAIMSTSSVVLGLLPTLLAILSPSISELALLGTQRPLLATLISLGSPGVLQTRVFEYVDPTELLDLPDHGRDNKRVRLQLAIGPWQSGVKSYVVSFLEYIFVAACVVNTVQLAYDLGQRAILTWGCTGTWPTVVWAFVPVVIHWIAAKGYRLTLVPKSGEISAPQISRVASNHRVFTDSKAITVTTAKPSPSMENTGNSSKLTITERLRQWFHLETTPCASHPPSLTKHAINVSNLSRPSKRVTVGVFLHCIAGFLSFVHLLYGTVTFSGLLFVSVLDAIGQIAMRFLLSCLVCRCIVLIEIAGMRGSLLGTP